MFLSNNETQITEGKIFFYFFYKVKTLSLKGKQITYKFHLKQFKFQGRFQEVKGL